MKVLGIDVGASKIEYIVVDPLRFRIVDRQRFSTPKTRKSFFDLLYNIITLSKQEYNINAIGMGIPGYIYKGKLLNSPNLPFLLNYNIEKWIKKEEKNTKISILIENDANLFTYAEALLGAGKNKDVVVGITWGSGIGGGLVINKEIYHGAYPNTLEIGHVNLIPNGRVCSCGRKGCLEAYAGGFSIAKIFHANGGSKKLTKVQDIYKTKKGKLIVKKAAQYLGIGISKIANLICPDVVVIGGGLSNLPMSIYREIEKYFEKYVLDGVETKIVKNKLGESAGVIGAALLAMQKIR